jgi:succinyl-CoA synthetase beta subunit
LVTAAEEPAWEALAYPVAVKAQVRAGGRGKGGGIVQADSAAQAREAARGLLATELAGERVEAVLVEPWLAAQRELYLSVTVDGEAQGYCVLYGPRGGVDVEQAPPQVHYGVGMAQAFRAHALRARLAPHEADVRVREGVVALARRLLQGAASHDCLTVEINPLLLTDEGRLVAVDAKVVLDEAAAARSQLVAEQVLQERKRQSDAVRRCLEGRLMLVHLGGEVGLISGGAGMTMATMDLIHQAGGRPACFLDCSANPTPEGYGLAFGLLDADPQVKAILVSIFGGATHMGRVAHTMRGLLEQRPRGKPVVFRLAGTHETEVGEVLGPLGIHNHTALADAVAAAVQAARNAP